MRQDAKEMISKQNIQPTHAKCHNHDHQNGYLRCMPCMPELVPNLSVVVLPIRLTTCCAPKPQGIPTLITVPARMLYALHPKYVYNPSTTKKNENRCVE